MKKRCPSCLCEDLTLFSKNKSNKDGLGTYCRQCACIKVKECYKKNPDKHRKSVREWQKSNKDKILLYRQTKLKQYLNKYQREYQKKRKEGG
jgi:hypothetical protein